MIKPVSLKAKAEQLKNAAPTKAQTRIYEHDLDRLREISTENDITILSAITAVIDLATEAEGVINTMAKVVFELESICLDNNIPLSHELNQQLIDVAMIVGMEVEEEGED